MISETNVLREAVAVGRSAEDGTEGKTSFLGFLVYFSIAGSHVTREDLRRAFEEADLDAEQLPKPINPRDAFRRATRGAEVRRVLVEEGGREEGEGPRLRWVNVMVRDVKSSGDELVRHVVRETVDSSNKRLSYEPVYELSLGEGTSGVGAGFTARPLVGEVLEEERRLVEQVRGSFDLEKDHYDSRAVRRLVTALLKGASSINLSESGGVYFVPREGTRIVRSLETLIEALKRRADAGAGDAGTRPKRRRSKFEVHYFVDKEEYREDLEEHLEEQVEEEAGSLIDELSRVLRDGTRITAVRQAGFIERFRGLKGKVEKYRGLLESELSSAATDLDLAERQMMEMMMKIEVKG